MNGTDVTLEGGALICSTANRTGNNGKWTAICHAHTKLHALIVRDLFLWFVITLMHFSADDNLSFSFSRKQIKLNDDNKSSMEISIKILQYGLKSIMLQL